MVVLTWLNIRLRTLLTSGANEYRYVGGAQCLSHPSNIRRKNTAPPSAHVTKSNALISHSRMTIISRMASHFTTEEVKKHDGAMGTRCAESNIRRKNFTLLETVASRRGPYRGSMEAKRRGFYLLWRIPEMRFSVGKSVSYLRGIFAL